MPNGRRSYLDTPYGKTTPDVASVQEFVHGYQAQQTEKAKDNRNALAVGVLTAIAVSSYGSYTMGKRPKYILGK